MSLVTEKLARFVYPGGSLRRASPAVTMMLVLRWTVSRVSAVDPPGRSVTSPW